MKKIITVAAVAAAIALAPSAAMAANGVKHEKILLGTAASAGVGALIAGPVGAVIAGGIGLFYTTQR